MPEYPSPPIVRFHSSFGPAGHDEASAAGLGTVKSPVGPPNRGQFAGTALGISERSRQPPAARNVDMDRLDTGNTRRVPSAQSHPDVLAPVWHSRNMATCGLVEYEEASPEVRAVYDDLRATRQTEYINNFWKALAHDPVTLRRTWESVKEIMKPGGALDPVVKEMIYVAVSATNGCGYCIASHTAGARKAGMTDAMFGELMAVVGMANETNRLATGYQVEIDEAFRPTR
jgi:AhpD family alkylhydroperoxidase